MTKPTKWVCTQRRLVSAWGSESSLSAWRNFRSLATHWAHSEDWSDWVDAQVDLSLRWGHTHFVGFVMWQLKSQLRHAEMALPHMQITTVQTSLHIIRHSLAKSITAVVWWQGWRKTSDKEQDFWPREVPYCNDPKFSDRQVWANNVVSDQTAPCVWSGSSLFAIPSASSGPSTV